MDLEGPEWQLAEACECGSTKWEVDEARNRVAALFNNIASNRTYAEVQQSCAQCGRPWPMLRTPSQACYRGGVPVYTGIPTPNSLASLSSNTSNTLEMISWQLNRGRVPDILSRHLLLAGDYEQPYSSTSACSSGVKRARKE